MMCSRKTKVGNAFCRAARRVNSCVKQFKRHYLELAERGDDFSLWQGFMRCGPKLVDWLVLCRLYHGLKEYFTEPNDPDYIMKRLIEVTDNVFICNDLRESCEYVRACFPQVLKLIANHDFGRIDPNAAMLSDEPVLAELRGLEAKPSLKNCYFTTYEVPQFSVPFTEEIEENRICDSIDIAEADTGRLSELACTCYYYMYGKLLEDVKELAWNRMDSDPVREGYDFCWTFINHIYERKKQK